MAATLTATTKTDAVTALNHRTDLVENLRCVQVKFGLAADLINSLRKFNVYENEHVVKVELQGDDATVTAGIVKLYNSDNTELLAIDYGAHSEVTTLVNLVEEAAMTEVDEHYLKLTEALDKGNAIINVYIQRDGIVSPSETTI